MHGTVRLRGRMQIKNINVKNFRSILDESLPCDSLTALVGRNGSGKSSFLSALEIFYDPSASITTTVCRKGPPLLPVIS